MSTNVDDRIVRMQFDATGFEAGAAKVLNTLDKIGSALNLTGAASGLENVQKAVGGFDISPVANAVDTAKGSFSALEQIGVGAFRRLGEVGVDFVGNAVKKVGNALTRSARDGFSEYQQQINSVQTISANSGESLETIQKNLDELNLYADKTSYVFSDMTSAIGRFTAAGLGVESSTKAIQGFFNAAALSGASSEAASRGVYQLSQAMSAGVVKLQDWKSIENASIDTEKFRDIIIATANHMGVADEKFKEVTAGTLSFRDSLSSGWLSADVMQAALENLTMSTLDFEDAEKGRLELMEKLVNSGYSEDVATQIIDIATAADKSAREIRTYRQLMDTLGESMGSGWAETWRLIIGDLGEATTFFTWIGERFAGIIKESADARNAMVKDWVDSGGRKALIGAIANIIEVVQRFKDVITDAFTGVFGVSGNQLAILTENIAWFSESIVISEETMQSFHDTLFDFLTIIHSIFGIAGNAIRIIFAFSKVIVDAFVGIREPVKRTDTIFASLADVFNKLHVASDALVERVEDMVYWFGLLKNRTGEAFFRTIYQNLSDLGFFGSALEKSITIASAFGDIFRSLTAIVKSWFRGFKAVVIGLWNLTGPLRNFVAFISSTFLDLFIGSLPIIVKLFDTVASLFDSFVTMFTKNFNVVTGLLTRIQGIVFGFIEALISSILDSSLFNIVRNVLLSIMSGVLSFLPKLAEFGLKIQDFLLAPLNILLSMLDSFGADKEKSFKDWLDIIINILGGPFIAVIKGALWVFEQIHAFITGPLAAAWGWLVEQFSGMSLTNPFSGLLDYISNLELKNPFEKFDIPNKLAKKIENMKKKFEELGTSADDAKFSLKRFMKQASAKIVTTGKNGFDSVIARFKDGWNKLKTYFTELTQNGNSFSKNIEKIFSDVYYSLKTWVGSIAENVDGFGGTLAKGFLFVVEQVEKIPSMLKTIFGETKKATETGAKNVKKSAETFADDQKTFWNGIFDSIPSIGEIGEKLSGFFNGIKETISGGLKNLVFGEDDKGGLKASLSNMFDFSGFKIVLPDFASPILDFVDQFNEIIERFDTETLGKKVDDVTTITGKGGTLLAAFSGFRLVNSWIRANNAKAKKNKGMGDMMSQLPTVIGGAFEGFGKGFGKDAGKELGGGLKEIGKAITEFGKSFSPFTKKQALSKSFLQVSEGILLLAGALLVLSKVPADDLERAAEAMLKILGVTAGFTFVMAYLAAMAKFDLKGVGLAMAGLGVAMLAIAGSIYIFTKMSADPNIVVGMNNFKMVIEVLTACMAGLILLSGGSNLKGVAITLLALTTAITLSLVPITLLGIMPTKIFTVGKSRLESLIFFYTMCTGLLEVISSVASGGAMLAATVSMLGLVAVATLSIIPVTLFSLLPKKTFVTGGNRVGALITFFGVVEGLLGVIVRNGAGALKATIAMIPLILAVTLAIIPVTILGLLPVDKVAQGERATAKLGVLLGALVALFTVISANVLAIAAAAVGMTLMVIPLTLMAVVVTLLAAVASYDLDGLKAAVDTFYNIVVVIGSMALIGVLGGGGLFVMAAGITAIAAALGILAYAIDAIDINKFLNDINALLTGLAEAGANAWIGFIDGITGGLGTAFKTGVQMALEFLSGLIGSGGLDEHSPSVKTEEAGELAAEGFINGVAKFFGLTEDAGEENGESFLNGLDLADLPTKLAESAANAVNSFIDNVNVDEIVQKGTDIATGLVNGIINNIHTDELVQKGNEITAGLVDGLGSDAAKELVAFPGKVFSAIVDGIKTLFGIKSPSTVMKEEVGMNILQGLIDGLADGTMLESLGSAVLTIGQSILDGLMGLPEWLKTKAEEGVAFFTGGFNSKSGEVEASGKDLSTKSVAGVKTLPDDLKKKSVEGAMNLAIGLASKTSEIRTSMQQNVDSAEKPTKALPGDLRQSGSSGGEGFAGGISSKQSSAYNAGASLSSNARSGVGSMYDSMYWAGSNGAQGLIDGVRSKISAVASQAISMAKTLVNNTLSTLKVNSPSKVFIGIGHSVGEGLVMGVADNTKAVAKSSSKLAEAIPSSFTDTLDKMSYSIDDILNTDYNPVISPVIDPASFYADLSSLSSTLNSSLASSVAMGTFNYNETFAGKFDEMNDVNRQAMKSFAENAIDYNLLGQAVANALIRSGVHVEMDGGQLMGYIAGEIQDARRMYR